MKLKIFCKKKNYQYSNYILRFVSDCKSFWTIFIRELNNIGVIFLFYRGRRWNGFSSSFNFFLTLTFSNEIDNSSFPTGIVDRRITPFKRVVIRNMTDSRGDFLLVDFESFGWSVDLWADVLVLYCLAGSLSSESFLFGCSEVFGPKWICVWFVGSLKIRLD